MTEVWIVQPYVPSYRIRFFEDLREALSRSGIGLKVVAGRPDAVQAKRGDAIEPPWLTTADDRVIRAFGRSLTLTRTRRYWNGADAVIVPHMGSSLDALSALARKSGLKVGVWGHISSYTAKPNAADQAIERWQLRRADHVFAYTPGGARFALRSGVPADRLTTVMNTVDTSTLAHDLASLSPSELAAFRSRNHLEPEQTVLAFLGGLDGSKRIEFLATVLDELWRTDRSCRLLVAGAGEQSAVLDRAVARGQATMLGYLRGREKAAMLASSAAIVNPGRIGLLAVEGLVANRPIVTTDWPYHAPEVEYLVEGESLYKSADDARAFAELTLRIARRSHHSGEDSQRRVPTMEQMVDNFSAGIRAMLGDPRDDD